MKKTRKQGNQGNVDISFIEVKIYYDDGSTSEWTFNRKPSIYEIYKAMKEYEEGE